ncbi:hypothetical protein bthur0007_60650 [Bacillus thuringiensis serovar monterrey BGSC 4AJ1]|nr:hypothetical protein bthur0007_60650 [Bacillus thuringiensis serovar monterrey BGSC 4AJ1]EEM86650.1 hypothetical protein bthur0012_53350 [Bacillus thuringiensis serovar pulsiensis BGSC 4CC1]
MWKKNSFGRCSIIYHIHWQGREKKWRIMNEKGDILCDDN